MTTEKDVAAWMLEQFNASNRIYQESIVYKIKRLFGNEFVFKNANGNYGISKGVLKHFRDLTEGKAIWERGSRSWRHLRDGEEYSGRQKD